jgi:hypothetical protein
MVKPRKCKLPAVISLAAVCISCSAWGQTPAVTFSNTAWNVTTVGNYTYGFEFLVGQSFAIAGLGVFDDNLDGLAESHQVSLWAGTSTALVSTSVPGGTAAPLVNQFRYVTFQPVTLTAGQLYTVGAYYATTNETLVDDVANLGVDSHLSIIGGRYSLGNAKPVSDDSYQNPALFGVNFLIVPAPEPSTCALLAMAGAILAARSGQRKQAAAIATARCIANRP